MKKIKLTQGKYTFVDNEDFNKVNQFKWYARKDRHTFYAQRKFKINGKWKNVMLHRFILNPPDNMFIDHVNRNGLDNRRNNIRVVTHSQNHFNEKLRSDNTSGYKGVYWNSKNLNWNVCLGNKYLGAFKSKAKAIECREKALNKLF